MACIRKRRNRWVIDFYDQEGKRHWLTMPEGSTRNEANEKLGEMEKKIRQGVYTPVKELPYFSEVADGYLTSKQASIRHSTHEQYKGHVVNHLKSYFEKVKINHINFDAIEKFKQHSLAKGVTSPTLCKILITLGAILTHAVRMHYIDFNPAREVEKPKGNSLHGEKDEMVILKPEEIRALLDATPTQKDRVLFMSAVLTGAREGELLGLKWDDFDWFNSQVHIRRTFNHGKFMEPKSKTSRRKIDLAPELVLELKKWKLACPNGELNLVFPSETGQTMNAANMVTRNFFPALRRAGLPQIRFHDLRHGYASLLIAQGEHPKYIQSQMGHSSINVTMDIYGHLMDTVNQKAACRLGRTVLGKETDQGENGSKMVAEAEK
jgi:integrase